MSEIVLDKMRKDLQRLLMFSNAITASHRHGIKISKKDLDNLSELQIYLENKYGMIGSSSDSKKEKEFDEKIKYYNESGKRFEISKIEKEYFTCHTCIYKYNCKSAFDLYNTDGDCLESK